MGNNTRSPYPLGLGEGALCTRKKENAYLDASCSVKTVGEIRCVRAACCNALTCPRK